MTNNEPSSTQLYYTGTITNIKKLDSNIDGAKLYYWVTLDDGSGHAVTKNSRFFIAMPMPFGSEEDPGTKFTKVREEIDFDAIQVGQMVELWERKVNEHAYEIYELKILDPTDIK
ncbi:hypothetical protein [Paenibacillus bovis]|uniref:Uncharacterized protein n=1 Tax=Paenibacillus bovis TaxID=1616788 RepID=A0A172ZCZ9_9BACL|nr:hypothetical protein [Paenibacillus bovis]ANF95232.1 hypothetical protein AR543_03780 [Paenibacillus bovis]